MACPLEGKNNHMCTGCGQCCRKGGPLLHLEDMPLVAQGQLPFTALVTLRAGELARDDVADRLIPLEEEGVKLAGTGEAGAVWRCVFHNADNTCAVYRHRPAQCRALSCRDTSDLAAMYDTHRASRAHVLRHAPTGWLDLAEAHEEQCPLRPLVPLAARIEGADWQGDENVNARLLLEAVRYDLAFRELSMEKGQVPQAALPCILGRPVTVFLRSLGLEVATARGGRLRVRRVAESSYPW